MERTATTGLPLLGLVLGAAACACLGCSSTPKYADYVGNPVDMNHCCARAATVCPSGDDWMACSDDQYECYRLGLWFEDGIKVPRDPKRAHAIFESMCDRFNSSSCRKLCERGDSRRCVDEALLGISGTGGRPFPPDYEKEDRGTFDKACRGGDDVACLMLGLDYVHGSQRVVQRVNNCQNDHARCFAMACNESDPLGCALLCHVGDSRACSQLGELALSGVGFNKPMVQVASHLLESRCKDKHDGVACMTLAIASRVGRGMKADRRVSRDYVEAACPSVPVACTLLGRMYRDGEEVGADLARAEAYLKQACDKSQSQGCIDLAVLLLQAPGGEEDKERAMALLRDPCADDEHSDACRILLADGKVCPLPGGRKSGASEGCVRIRSDAELAMPTPPYGFQLTEGKAGAIPRPPPPPQRPVGEGLWSGWKTVGNTEGGSFGLTPVVTRTVGEGHRSTHASGLAGFFTEIYMQSWYPGHDKYLRFNLAGAIGGGSAGVDGQVFHDAMGGFRLPFFVERSNPFRGSTLYQSMPGKDQDALDSAIFTHSPHALFVRGGYSLRYSAVGPLLSSAIELPRVEAGYHFEGEGDALRGLELRTNAALVLVGRFNVGDDEHPLGGAVAWGASMVMHTRRAHVQVGAQRIQAALIGDRSPVHRVDTNSCLRVVARDERHYKYLVCLQEVLEHGTVGAGKDVTAWQTGVFFGLDGLD